MNRQLVKSVGNLTARLSRCQISTSAVLGNQSAVLSQEARDKIHPRIGTYIICINHCIESLKHFRFIFNFKKFIAFYALHRPPETEIT